MRKLLILIGVTLLGWMGWWLGARFGLMTGYILSGIGSMAGAYLGWRLHRDYFE
jgi:hypothetical protein